MVQILLISYNTIFSEHEMEKINAVRNTAARTIQSWWRTYRTRKIFKIKKQFKKELLGIKKVRQLKRPNRFSNSVLEMYNNEKFKNQLDEDFAKLIMDERTRLLQARTPWMMEDISDHIRAWFEELYRDLSIFPYTIYKSILLNRLQWLECFGINKMYKFNKLNY